MLQKYIQNISFFLAFLIFIGLTGCREEDLFVKEDVPKVGHEVEFVVSTHGYPDTRGVEDESKKEFEEGELLHIRAVYDCSRNGNDVVETQYGVLKYAGKGKWTPLDEEHSMHWPDDAVTATFHAYYLHGSTGVLSKNTMEPKLLSSYSYGEDPLHGEALDVSYGATVRLEMFHIFSHLTLTEMNNAVPSELWFAVPKSLRWTKELNEEEEPEFNNAFYLDFDETTKIMTPVFTSLPSALYKDKDGDDLSFVEGTTEQYDTEDGEVMTRVSYFLQPRKYHCFSLLYARSHNEHSSYLSYTRNLVNVLIETTGKDALLPNGRYEFSILKSLGVLVEQEPDDNWDDNDPIYIVNVEDFLKAAANGDDYWEEDQANHDRKIQILERTMNGTRLLENIDFHHEFYNDVFNDGYVPNLSNTFDGNYHYIHNLGSPLFYINQGNIINLGIRNAKIANIESNERFPVTGYGTFDTSYNGLIACRNSGSVRNIRLIGAEMTVTIRTSAEDNDQRTQERHNAAILFGENSGTALNISLAQDLKITVKNADDETIVPNVMIGGLAGQNLGTISGVSSLNDEKYNYDPPRIIIINECIGDNGVYLVGGVAGLSTGTLDNILIASVDIDGTQSSGVETHMGGLVGEIPNSNTGAPKVEGCIVKGNVKGGTVKSLTNVTSLAYTGGLAGSLNLQAKIVNNSVSFGIRASTGSDSKVTYATGGAFGRIVKSIGTIDGKIQLLAAFGSELTGMSNYIGNFAGIVPQGYDWDFKECEINVKNFSYNNIGTQM